MVSAKRDELLDLLDEALAQYEAGEADLLALVHDVDSLIIELTLVSDPIWIDNVRNQWTGLARALVEQRRTERWELTEPLHERVASAVSGLRFLAETSQTPTAV